MYCVNVTLLFIKPFFFVFVFLFCCCCCCFVVVFVVVVVLLCFVWGGGVKINLYWCNLLIHVVSITILRSV